MICSANGYMRAEVLLELTASMVSIPDGAAAPRRVIDTGFLIGSIAFPQGLIQTGATPKRGAGYATNPPLHLWQERSARPPCTAGTKNRLSRQRFREFHCCGS